MSRDLYAQGKPRDVPPTEVMSDRLRFILRHRVWDDEPCTWEERWLTKADVPYLEGLIDADVEDAEKLRDMIREYGEVKVWIE